MSPACWPFLATPLAPALAAACFLAAPGPALRAGWAAARTSARRADRARRRRHVVTAKNSPSSNTKTTPAMAASLTRVPRISRWIGLLCDAGGLGGACPAVVFEEAGLDTVSAMAAAAVSAVVASTVPKPEPSARPPGGWYTVLVVSALVTCAGFSVGNWARMSATMPATTALAALVLLSCG